jgi:hypothetical protein
MATYLAEGFTNKIKIVIKTLISLHLYRVFIHSRNKRYWEIYFGIRSFDEWTIHRCLDTTNYFSIHWEWSYIVRPTVKGVNTVILKGDSVARDPKPLSIKKTVIEIMT